MPRRREKLDEIFCVPITKTLKQRINKLADRDERKPAEMGRILMSEALEAREKKVADRSLATA